MGGGNIPYGLGGAGGFGGGGGGGGDGNNPGAGGFGGGSGGLNSGAGRSSTGGGGAALGGAIFNNQGATLSIINSTLADNTAQGGDGGSVALSQFYKVAYNTGLALLSINPGTAGQGLGSAVFNRDGTVVIVNSTIAGNSSLGPTEYGRVTTPISPTQFTDSDFISSINDYIGQPLALTLGPNLKESRTITAFDPTTGTFTVASPFGGTIASGDSFLVITRSANDGAVFNLADTAGANATLSLTNSLVANTTSTITVENPGGSSLGPTEYGRVTTPISPTKFTDSNFIGSIDDYLGQTLTFINGANTGVSHLITAFDPATGTFTVASAFPFTIASGDNFAVTAATIELGNVTTPISPTQFTDSNLIGSIDDYIGQALTMFEDKDPTTLAYTVTETRIVTAFDPATGTFTVASAFGGTIASGDKFAVDTPFFVVNTTDGIDVQNEQDAGTATVNVDQFDLTTSAIGNGTSGTHAGTISGAPTITDTATLNLGPLQNNGGPTQTMALLPGSLAIGRGAVVPGITTDQRGLPRPPAGPWTIGAFEVNTADPAESVVTVSASLVTYGGTATITLQAKDPRGTNESSGGLTVAFALGAGSSRGSLSAVTDNHNGTYTATFTATAVGTARTITATLNGVPVTTTLPRITVTPAPLTVTANPEVKVAGSADPTLTYATSGLQLSDTAATVLVGGLSRDPGEAAGSYLIRQGRLLLAPNANYTLTFVGSVLYITSASTSLTGAQSVAVSSSGGPATATAAGGAGGAQLTATASAFDGTLTAAQFAGSPVSGFSAGGTFFDVNVASSDLVAASAVQLVLQNLTPLAPLSWYNGSTFVPVLDASGNAVVADASGSATVTLTLATSPSLANLHGTYFLGSLAPLSATPVSVSATAGAPFSGTLATFTPPLGTAASYTAVITWGDGSTSAGTISSTGSTLTVTGSHTYADPVNETIHVTISHIHGYTTPATTTATATVTNLGQGVTPGLTGGIGFWHYGNGQALIQSFNGGPSTTALSAWLAATFPNLYGTSAGGNNLTGRTNTQVAAFYLTQFDLDGPKVEAQVLAVALNVYATTASLGGSAGTAYGFTVSATGLGARSYNVGSDGAAFGVANNTTRNVYELLLAVNARAVHGVLYNGDGTLRQEAADLFDALNNAGGIG
jgi:hypothetical protein